MGAIQHPALQDRVLLSEPKVNPGEPGVGVCTQNTGTHDVTARLLGDKQAFQADPLKNKNQPCT